MCTALSLCTELLDLGVLEGKEEDIINVPLAKKGTEIKVFNFLPEHDNRSYLSEFHYIIN